MHPAIIQAVAAEQIAQTQRDAESRRLRRRAVAVRRARAARRKHAAEVARIGFLRAAATR